MVRAKVFKPRVAEVQIAALGGSEWNLISLERLSRDLLVVHLSKGQ